MPLTPADVRNKQFSTTRLRPGYDEAEVDAFLDEIENEFSRLIQENEELRSKLAESLRGSRPAIPAMSSQPQGMPVPQSMPEPEMHAPQLLGAPAPVRDQERWPEPQARDMGGHDMAGHDMNSITRVLSLAQQTADQAVADARREADDTLGRARREAGDILTKARHQAEQITSDAQARSESLERDAQERYRLALGSLMQQREDLERRVDDLGAFEREHRGRLRAYLEGQLRDLDAGAAVNDGPPAMMPSQHFSTSGNAT
jgi:DivIVA domain-containing protein